MSSYSEINETGAKPPEQENSEPAGDGRPERSTAPRGDAPHQTKLVSDDAEAFEEQQTGIAVSYVLKKEEVCECLKQTGLVKRNTWLTALPFVFAAVFLAAGFRTGNKILFYTAFAVAGASIGAFAPRSIGTLAKRIADGSPVYLEIFPDRIEFGHDRKYDEIPLDGTSESARVEETIALIVPASMAKGGKPHLVVLPLRCVGRAARPDVEAMILAGTKPRKLRG
jgi:hypothetical protein